MTERRSQGTGRKRRAFEPSVQTLEGRELLSGGVATATAGVNTSPELTSAAGVLNPSLPLIRDGHVMVRHGSLQGVVLRFTHDMAPGPVSDVQNYQLFELFGGKPLQPLSIPLSAAVYHSGQRAVTLIPAQQVELSAWAKGFVVTSPAVPASPLTDTDGVPLDDTGSGQPSGQLNFGLRLHANTPGPIEYQKGLVQILNSYRPYKTLNNVVLPIAHVVSPVPFF